MLDVNLVGVGVLYVGCMWWCMWGVCGDVCEVYVRCMWAVCGVYVGCLWGVCGVFVGCM